MSSPKQGTSEVLIDWCDKDGCGAGQGFTLTQRIQAIINDQIEICADLKVEDGNLKYTQIDCDEAVRKPLCMKGEPMVQFSSAEARFSKLRHLKSHRNKLLFRKQKLLKARLKLLNKKLRHDSSLSRKVRQADAPPVDMCITGGLSKLTFSLCSQDDLDRTCSNHLCSFGKSCNPQSCHPQSSVSAHSASDQHPAASNDDADPGEDPGDDLGDDLGHYDVSHADVG